MDIITRSEWKARPPTNTHPWDIKTAAGLAGHYEATPEIKATDDHAKCYAQIRSIQNYHMDHNGWADIAYNFLTCTHGGLFEGRGWLNRNAANGWEAVNAEYLAVCHMSNDDANELEFTLAAQAAWVWLYTEAIRRGAGNKFVGHRDIHATQCPGNEIYAWITSKKYLAVKTLANLDADDLKAIAGVLKSAEVRDTLAVANLYWALGKGHKETPDASDSFLRWGQGLPGLNVSASVDADAVASSLAKNTTFLSAIAKAVADENARRQQA